MARSRISDARVWRRARDYLGLMNEPAICLSILGPSRPSHGYMQNPGTVNWNEGATKMVVDIPFYILGEQEGKFRHAFLAVLKSSLPMATIFYSKYFLKCGNEMTSRRTV